MKLIQPAEISGKIMSLIDDTNSFLILVSPYNNISKWYKLINRLNSAIGKNVNIDWYIRKNEGNKLEIEQLNIIPVEIPNLHSKIYLNEKSAIITSLNLNQYSDSNSLDIAMETENSEEYDEIKYYIKKYIEPWKEHTINLTTLKGNNFKDIAHSYLMEMQKIKY